MDDNNTGELVSIVVPVYNTAQYLPRCLNSIVAQTYPAIEVLIIDDGSTDASPQIIDEYAANYSFIKVEHLEHNGGTSAARNRAIDLAQGAYLTCIDSDDYVEPDYVERLVQGIAGVDLALIGFRAYDRDASIEDQNLSERTKHQAAEVTFNELSYEIDSLRDPKLLWYLHIYVSGKLFRTDIIHQHDNDETPLRFPEEYSYAEDSIFVMQYLRECHKFHSCAGVGYHYCRRRGNSLSFNNNINLANLIACVNAWDATYKNRWTRELYAVRSEYLMWQAGHYLSSICKMDDVPYAEQKKRFYDTLMYIGAQNQFNKLMRSRSGQVKLLAFCDHYRTFPLFRFYARHFDNVHYLNTDIGSEIFAAEEL